MFPAAAWPWSMALWIWAVMFPSPAGLWGRKRVEPLLLAPMSLSVAKCW